MVRKLKIAVIFGGCSPEYDVSLQSAEAVIRHMDSARFTPILIGITRQGDWFHFQGEVEMIATDTWHDRHYCTPVALLPDRSARALLRYGAQGVEKLPIDAAFPILHGKNGEDGIVQGALSLANIPIVGCGVLSSALCMDKVRAHQLVSAAGITVPRAYVCKKNTAFATILQQAAQIGYPLFIKPLKSGSSLGITRITEPSQLTSAVRSALAYDEHIVIEEAIAGFEVGCAIMGDDKLIVGEVDEIALTQPFFDHTEKYTLQTSTIHVPARLDPFTTSRIKKTAQQIYKLLDCCGFARVDMFLTPAGEIVFNEVNTIPGFTAHSRFPNMLKACGMSFAQIITTAIEQAVRS